MFSKFESRMMFTIDGVLMDRRIMDVAFLLIHNYKPDFFQAFFSQLHKLR